MKSETIEMLHKGSRRKVQKLQYSKIRPYNKIQSSRVATSRVEDSSASRSLQSDSSENKFSQRELIDIIECLKKDNKALHEEMLEYAKLIRKEEKINRVLAKKLGQNKEENLLGSNEADKQIGRKNLIAMLQINLSLEVIQLQSILEQKNQELTTLSNPRKRNKEFQQLKQSQYVLIEFFKIIFPNQLKISAKSQELNEKGIQIEQQIHNVNQKLKNVIKNKQKQQKILEEVCYEIRQMQEQTEKAKKKIRKNSCQYIEIQNGEMRNEQDLKTQIKLLKEQRKKQSQNIQFFVQNEMRKKIRLLNQIQILEEECRLLGIEYEKTIN